MIQQEIQRGVQEQVAAIQKQYDGKLKAEMQKMMQTSMAARAGGSVRRPQTTSNLVNKVNGASASRGMSKRGRGETNGKSSIVPSKEVNLKNSRPKRNVS
jgi:hypothetical protein